ncbi:uncharacterized protein [Branchiostoma lanceolatum]|uniref:uncharacterized protein n=1 Tax=Branchiostoma lanceolatum TaxID=7740 RepID=UPI0034551D69
MRCSVAVLLAFTVVVAAFINPSDAERFKESKGLLNKLVSQSASAGLYGQLPVGRVNRSPAEGISTSRANPPELKKVMGKRINLKINSGREIKGVLRGFDPFMNLVLDKTVDVLGNDLGMVVVRGNSVVLLESVGEAKNRQTRRVMVQPIVSSLACRFLGYLRCFLLSFEHFFQNLIFRWLQNKARVQVWLYENTNIRMEGKIVGFDEYMNLVLDDAEEIHLKTKNREPLGRILLKGDNITLIHMSS